MARRLCAAPARADDDGAVADGRLSRNRSPEHATPNMQFHVQPLSLDRFGEPLHAFPAITISVCNLRPDEPRLVHATSPDPDAAPAIQPNYLATDEDRGSRVDAMRLVRRIVAAAARCSGSRRRNSGRAPQLQRRRRPGAGRGRHRHDDLPSGRHGEDGSAGDPMRCGRRAPAGARRGRPARARRLGHAAHHLGQHQFADDDDRREGRG